MVIADYGASTGHNSLVPIGAAIAKLRARTRSEHAVLVAHTDVPENDFTALFRTLDDDPDSYLRRDKAVFGSAVGRSFYQQILPSNSVMLGWSSWACQWLSRVPGPVADHVQVAYSGDGDVKAAYARQAAHDWHEFVAFRGRELSPGGRLVVLTMAIDDEGRFGYRALLDAIVAGLAVLRDGDLLTDDEVRGISVPMVGRSAEDFRVPFAPKGRFESLTVEHVEVFHAEDRFWTQYQSDQDATAYGQQWAAFARVTVFPAMADALSGGSADPRRAEFLDRLEKEVADRVTSAPEPMLIPLAKVVLAKDGTSR
jgi:salicylate 1-O-methyltransferase